jgi:hypothetical protein
MNDGQALVLVMMGVYSLVMTPLIIIRHWRR